MRKKNVILIFSLILVIAILGCTQTVTTPAVIPTGRVVFTITDVAADMGTVSSVLVTIDSVSVHRSDAGWINVTFLPGTYDLLELNAKGRNELLADVQLNEGQYQQIRLQISNVTVVDDKGAHDAKLPSSELKIVANLLVEANSTSTVTFDFIANESLHITGGGKYIMAPVIRLEIREGADVETGLDNVEITGGTIKTNTKIGMDAAGNVGAGKKIPADMKIYP